MTLFTGTCGPVPAGTRITQPYGYDPTYPGNPEHVHYGIDFGVVTGTPITATPEVSTVVRAGEYPGTGYGNVVVLRYADDWYLLHAHLSQPLVTLRQTVVRGMVIGLSGNSGFSTGPHLHFGQGKGGYWAGSWGDPMPWLLSLEVDELSTRYTEEQLLLLDKLLIANAEAEDPKLRIPLASALLPTAIAARDAALDAAHDTAATNDPVSRGIRRLTKLLEVMQLTEVQLRAMSADEVRNLVLDLINVEVPA